MNTSGVNLPVDSAPKHTLAHTLRPELGRIVLGCLCLVGTNAFSLAIPWLLKQSIDALRSLAPRVAHGIVVRDAIAIIAFAVLQGLIRTWSRIFIFDAARNVEYGLRRDLLGHLTRLDPAFYRRHPTGDIMSRLTNDLTAVRALYGPGLLNVFNTALVYATALALLLQLSPRLTLLALIPYPLLMVAARLASRRIHRASRAIQDQLGTMSTAIQEDLAGIAVIKHYTLEESRQRAFRGVNDEYLARALALVRVRGALMPMFAMLGGIGTLIVLWAGGREVIAGRMTVGSLVAFNGYLVLLSWPTFALGWIIGIWQRGMAGWARVRELLDTRPGIADAPDAVARGGHADARRSRCATWRSRPTSDGCWTASRSSCRRARRWRSSGPPGRARRRWSTPCCACRRSRRAPSASAATTSRASRSPSCAG